MESVNDGLFHTVELLIQNRSLSLVVDTGAPKSLGKLARQPSVDHNTQLYIGGTHAYTHWEFTLVLNIQMWPPSALYCFFCGCNYIFALHDYIKTQSPTACKYTFTLINPSKSCGEEMENCL